MDRGTFKKISFDTKKEILRNRRGCFDGFVGRVYDRFISCSSSLRSCVGVVLQTSSKRQSRFKGKRRGNEGNHQERLFALGDDEPRRGG
jgi:hypothetical protein